MTHFPLLSFLIFFPILAAVMILLTNNSAHPLRAKILGLLTLLISLAGCIPLYIHFDFTTYHMQFIEQVAWLPGVGINYQLGLDGISMPFVLLSTFISLVTLLATWQSVQRKVPQYIAALLILQGIMVGVFTATDAILFYIFWEAVLVPMFLLIGIWGSDNRVYAAIKFFLYTFLGSILMLIALLYLGFKAHTFEIAAFYPLKLTVLTQNFVFLAFLFAFAIKVPMWPVHTWLPDAHTEAPAGGSMILAAILLKMGGYGFLRFSLPIVPNASHHFSTLMITLSLIAIVYIALVALVQTDMKKLVAYSSISHMGFVTLGCFMGYRIVDKTGQTAAGMLGFEGAIVVMLSHAFISAALFAGIGYLYDRLHTRNIKDFGGVVNSMPIFASFFLLFLMANAGLPGTSGFVGEFMVILNSLSAGYWIATLAATTLIFGAAYNLWMYKRVIFGKVNSQAIATLQDISGCEVFAYILLAAMVIGIGLYPAPLVKVLHASAEHLQVLSQAIKFA